MYLERERPKKNVDDSPREEEIIKKEIEESILFVWYMHDTTEVVVEASLLFFRHDTIYIILHFLHIGWVKRKT
jgi:hypothetical protein